MTALFSCFSFCFWLSDFQAEYLGSDIYVLFYAQGVIAIVSGQLVLAFYETHGTKNLLFYSTAVTLVSAALMVLMHQHIIAFGDEGMEQTLLAISIPILLLFMSCAIQVGYTAVI